MPMSGYVEQIREAESEADLNSIIEAAAFDDTLSHAQYTKLYELAVTKYYHI